MPLPLSLSLSPSQVDSLSEDITNIETLIQKIAKNYKIPLPKESMWGKQISN